MPRRVVDIGTHRYTQVVAADEPGAGGANHRYAVELMDGEGAAVQRGEDFGGGPYVLATVEFAHGPFENTYGVNGLFNEDLLAMVIDRLQAFNAGPFKCRENAIAITKIEEAMLWLKKRTDDRERRGVLGTAAV